MKRITAFFLAFSLLIPGLAYAKTYVVFCENNITVNDTAQPGEKLTYTVLKSGKKLSDYDGTNPLDVFAAYDETSADKDGNFAISFKTQAESGIYPVIVYSQNGGKTENEIYYIKESENKTAREQIDTATDTAAFVLANKYALGLDISLLNEDTVQKTAILYKAENKSASELGYEKTYKMINKCAAVVSLCDGKINLYDSFESLDFDEETQSRLTASYMDAEAQAYLIGKLKKDYASLSSFDSDFKEALVLTTVKKADGFGYVRDVIKKYGKDLSLSVDKVNDDVARKLVGNDYTIKTLETAIINAYNDSGSSTGGGSGSSSSKGGKVSGISAPAVSGNNNGGITNPQTAGFNDLDGYEWAKGAVEALAARSVINGKAPGVFAPYDLVSREEFVKIAMKTAGFANISGEFKMDDISENDWFYQDVKNAYLSGIISGISANMFGSGQPVTRQDMAVILYNVLNKKGITVNSGNAKNFIDEAFISEYAKEAVHALSAAGIINGDQNGAFNPMNNATRAEAAKMVYGIISYTER